MCWPQQCWHVHENTHSSMGSWTIHRIATNPSCKEWKQAEKHGCEQEANEDSRERRERETGHWHTPQLEMKSTSREQVQRHTSGDGFLVDCAAGNEYRD